MRQALDGVARHSDGPLAAELRRIGYEVARGRRLADALDDLPPRGEALRPLVAALVAADRYGAPLGPGLERLADDVRATCRRRAEELARRVPVKLLFPLVTCILPAFALLTVAPLIASALRSLRLPDPRPERGLMPVLVVVSVLPPGGVPPRPRSPLKRLRHARARDQRGQATAEYALVLLGVAAGGPAGRELGHAYQQDRRPVQRHLRLAPRARPEMTGREDGQAAVELALVLPFVLLLFLALLQVGLVVRDEVLVVHAAREAARRAAVDPSPAGPRLVALAGSGLPADRLTVTATRQGPGGVVEVTVRYRSPTGLPLIGPLLPDVRLEAKSTMRVEL